MLLRASTSGQLRHGPENALDLQPQTSQSRNHAV
jgi:hypothetical protein